MNRSARSQPRKSRVPRLIIGFIVTQAVLLAVLAAGISAFNHGTAHAVHPLAAAPAAIPDAWQTPASDPSLPSARERFRAQTTPGFDDLPPTF